MDARRFFSVGIDIRGNLPQLLLQSMYNDIATGIVQAHLNVPYAQLLGQEPGQPSYSSDTGAEQAGSRTRSEPHTFWHVPPAIKTILRGARSKYPSLTVVELMEAHVPPLQYAQVKLGPN
jgi:hypothetical protein